jgi:hypothetical protein
MWLLAPILASILALSVLRLLRRQPLPAPTLAPDTASQVAQDTVPRISPLAIPWLAGPALALVGMTCLRVDVGGREATTLGVRSRLRLLLAQCTHVARWFWPAVALTLAGFLRLLRMCANSLWFDEAFSWLLARQQGYLLNNDPDAWLPPCTWGWAGRRVSSLNEAAVRKSRRWLVVRPDRLDDRQVRVLHQAEISYKRVGEWAWPSADPVQLRLYSLDNLHQPYDVQ